MRNPPNNSSDLSTLIDTGKDYSTSKQENSFGELIDDPFSPNKSSQMVRMYLKTGKILKKLDSNGILSCRFFFNLSTLVNTLLSEIVTGRKSCKFFSQKNGT